MQPEMIARAPAAAAAAIEQRRRTSGAGGRGNAGPDFTRVAAQTVRAVTNISSVQVVRRSASPFANDPFFQYFFGDQDDLFGRSRAAAEPGLGRRDFGRRLRRHQQARDRRDEAEVTVTVGDRREVRAKIIGVDSWTDLALLKIEATGLPVIPWGDSSKLRVAEWVMAVGNPFSLNQTVTLGIVSALGRANVGITQYEDFIQTDAAINPGQLRRRADQRARRAGRHQHRDLLAERRLPGHRLRRAQQPGAPRRRRPDEVRPRAPRIDWLRRGDSADRRGSPTNCARRAPTASSSTRCIASPRPTRPASSPATSSCRSTARPIADPSQFVRMVADSAIGSTARVEVLRDGSRQTLRIPIEAQQERRVRRR